MNAPRPHNPRIAGDKQVLYARREPAHFFATPVTHYKLIVTPQNGVAREFVTDLMTIGKLVEDLEPNIPVNATVAASADEGQTWGPEAVFDPITPVESPKAPLTNVIALASEYGVATITWSAPIEISDAIIQIQSVSENPDVPVQGRIVQDIQSGSAEFSGLDPNSVYRFSVVLRNLAGESPAVQTNSVDITGFSAPVPETTPIE
jgi:hypothetical protein